MVFSSYILAVCRLPVGRSEGWKVAKKIQIDIPLNTHICSLNSFLSPESCKNLEEIQQEAPSPEYSFVTNRGIENLSLCSFSFLLVKISFPENKISITFTRIGVRVKDSLDVFFRC